jgi:hypothetical protein
VYEGNQRTPFWGNKSVNAIFWVVVSVFGLFLVLSFLFGDDLPTSPTKPPTRSTVTWFPNPKYQKPITETKYCLRIFRVIPTPICWTDTE